MNKDNLSFSVILFRLWSRGAQKHLQDTLWEIRVSVAFPECPTKLAEQIVQNYTHFFLFFLYIKAIKVMNDFFIQYEEPPKKNPQQLGFGYHTILITNYK